MRRKILRLLIILGISGGVMLLSMVSAIQAEEAAMEQLGKSNNMFAFDLYAQLRKESGNLFFSPYSISTALAMTYAGARGTTEEQMAATLRFDLGSDTLHPAFASLAKHLADVQQQGDVALNVANALWLQQGFDVQQAFLDTLEQFYAANFFQVNFAEAYEAVREEINKWIEEQTRDKITNLLPPGTLNALTRLVLTNAIYFKGNWAQTFSPDATAEAPFWISPKKSVPVEMMYQQTVLKYGDIDEGQVVILPYAGEALSMVVLLPKERDGLNAMETKLTAERVTTWIAQAAAREVKVYLPKFRFTSQFNLSATLQTMGMQEAFSENADFSGMAADKQLSISDVVHKAFVEVNEEGTEAAAATAVIVGVTSVGEPPPIPVFQADHPFIFLIQDKLSGSFLFVGRVVNPGS